MKSTHKYLGVTAGFSVGLGCAATALVASSQNGYVAGFIYLPLLFLIAATSFVLIVVGLITVTKKVGPFLLLAALLLPTGFFVSAITAKYFEWGAYRQEPMVSLTPTVSNIVLFKRGTGPEEIEIFYDTTLGVERADGRGNENLPGLRTMARLPPFEGHEAVAFDFFDTASAEQREFVYSKVRSSPIVYKLLENVQASDFTASASSVQSRDEHLKKGVVTNSTTPGP